MWATCRTRAVGRRGTPSASATSSPCAQVSISRAVTSEATDIGGPYQGIRCPRRQLPQLLEQLGPAAPPVARAARAGREPGTGLGSVLDGVVTRRLPQRRRRTGPGRGRRAVPGRRSRPGGRSGGRRSSPAPASASPMPPGRGRRRARRGRRSPRPDRPGARAAAPCRWSRREPTVGPWSSPRRSAAAAWSAPSTRTDRCRPRPWTPCCSTRSGRRRPASARAGTSSCCAPPPTASGSGR